MKHTQKPVDTRVSQYSPNSWAHRIEQTPTFVTIVDVKLLNRNQWNIVAENFNKMVEMCRNVQMM